MDKTRGRQQSVTPPERVAEARSMTSEDFLQRDRRIESDAKSDTQEPARFIDSDAACLLAERLTSCGKPVNSQVSQSLRLIHAPIVYPPLLFGGSRNSSNNASFRVSPRLQYSTLLDYDHSTYANVASRLPAQLSRTEFLGLGVLISSSTGRRSQCRCCINAIVSSLRRPQCLETPRPGRILLR